jgi:hypothetical protein
VRSEEPSMRDINGKASKRETAVERRDRSR